MINPAFYYFDEQVETLRTAAENTREMKNSKARKAIIDTAARLFYKQGYTNTGINQIIEEAGIAKSTLYQHFKSKEELLIAYLKQTGETTVNALEHAVKIEGSPKDKIISMFTYLEDLVCQKEFYGCHFLNLVYEMPDSTELARQQVKRQKDAVRELIAQAVEPLQEEDLNDEIYTLFEGALIAHKIHNNIWPIRSAKNVIRKIL